MAMNACFNGSFVTLPYIKMKYLVALLLPLACNAWTPALQKHQAVSFILPPTTTPFLSMSSTGIPSEIDDGYWSDDYEEDPCWQNVYDDDCAMTNANLAFFKASVWVKGMPCAAGIEVRNK